VALTISGVLGPPRPHMAPVARHARGLCCCATGRPAVRTTSSWSLLLVRSMAPFSCRQRWNQEPRKPGENSPTVLARPL